jgi:predicted transposase/invertase (TIGR01784 family)
MEVNEHFHWSQYLEFHVIDLSQFMVKWKKYRGEMIKNRTTEYRWLMMLSAANIKNKTINQEMIQELGEFAMKEQEVREALIEWEMLSSNKGNRALYEARLKYLRDELSWIQGEKRRAREERLEEGRQKGFKIGEKRKAEEIAKKWLQKGFAVEDIAEDTGLTIEQVRNLVEVIE